MIDRQNRPCTLEGHLVSATGDLCLLVEAMTIEITKRVEMRKVSGIVVLFFPHGLFACASRPLVDAALSNKNGHNPSASGKGHVASILTTVSARAITSNGMVAKYSWKTMLMSSLF
jgi:hypothetical protein